MNENIFNLFKLSQNDLAKFIIRFCQKNNLEYKFKEDKYIFIFGNNPGCLVAHLDTVHKKLPSNILKRTNKNNQIEYYAKEGIGADDRAGVIAALFFLQKKQSHALFTFDEETGGVGVRDFVKSDLFNQIKDNINIWIEFDRKGNNDYVTYGYENEDVFKILEENNFNEARGTYSDVSTLSQASDTLGVNISTGYYNAHRSDEYLILNELSNNINRIKNCYDSLISEKRECIQTQSIFTFFRTHSHNISLEDAILNYLLSDYSFGLDDIDNDIEVYHYYAKKIAYIYEKYNLEVDLEYLYDVDDAYEILQSDSSINEENYKHYIEKYISEYENDNLDIYDFESFINTQIDKNINEFEIER